MKQIPFRVLIYRFMFFSWLFRDVNRGNLFERHAAWQHNVDASRWLPLYLSRWLVSGSLLLGLGALIEQKIDAPIMSTIFYVPCALSASVSAVIVGMMACFRFMHVYVEPQGKRSEHVERF